MMHPQSPPSSYGVPPGSSNPPVQQMAGMGLGPQGNYQPPLQDNTHYNTHSSAPPIGGAPHVGSFPQHSSSYPTKSIQTHPGSSNVPGLQAGNFPQRSSSNGPIQQGQAQIPGTTSMQTGPPNQPYPNQPPPPPPMTGQIPPPNQLSGMGMGQSPSNQPGGMGIGPPQRGNIGTTPQMMYHGLLPRQPFQPPGSNVRGPPLSTGGGQPFQGFTNGLQSGPPSAGPPGALPIGPPGAGPPGALPIGPPGALPTGPPGALPTGPPGALPTGPPGALPTGPPGVPPGTLYSHPTGQPRPPGMSMSFPGMSMSNGLPVMPVGNNEPPVGNRGPPGMAMSNNGPPPGGPPPGMSMGPSGQYGPTRQRGPPGMQPGLIQQQPKSRIDPDHMPNPVEVMKADQDLYKNTAYRTTTQGLPPPLVSTAFTVQDDGNASPRYMRSTVYTIPCSKDLVNGCKIPMGLVIQAFARIPEDENTLHLVDHGTGGPIRCNRCKAYMNPFARFIDGGRRYLCPICQCSNEVLPEYFCHLDHQGQRTDAIQRPELCYGSVEYAATKDYCKEGKLPLPPAYIFMIDVSYGNNQSGLLDLLSHTILGLLDNLPGSSDEGGSPIKVGFVTYDRVIHFYNVKANMAQPQMMVMADVDDVFVPMVDGFLVNVSEAKTILESLMSQLAGMFSDNKAPQVVLEPVIRAGMEALKAAGKNGRIFAFHSSLPTAQATGMLKNRLDTKLLGTDKEKNLLNPASSPYQKLAEECVKYGVGIELFLFPNSYCDVATLGDFASSTGGEVHYYKNYVTNRDGDRLIQDLRHSLTRPTGFDCVMRVRASTGLRPTGFFGAFHMNNTTDIELGNIDCNKAIAVDIKHDDKLRDDENAFFQAALLYTNVYGTRRLRVHNLSLNCSSKFPDIYRSCEIDTISNFISKSILNASLTMSYKNIRESFIHQCAVILSCYRKNCSNQSPPGQLILPESLKLLPMYANCLLKSDALLSPPIVSLDEKCWLMRSLLSMPTALAGSFIYPRMFSLHDVDVNETGMPPLMRCTGQKLQDSGMYIVENGLVMVIWVGQQFGPDSIQKVFGVPSLVQVNTEMHTLPALDNPLSFRIRGVLEQIQSLRGQCMKLTVSKQKDKSEVHFRRLLKEDKGAGQWEGINYIEFLCQIHREIKEILN